MVRECAEILEIAGEHGPERLGECDDDGIDRGAPTSPSAQRRGTPSDGLGQFADQVAGLEEAIHLRIPVRTAGCRLDQHHTGNERRPPSVALKDRDQGRGLGASPGESADAPGIEHGFAPARAAPPCDRPAVALGRGANVAP